MKVMKIKIPDYDAIDFLLYRLQIWTDNKKIIELFKLMYLNQLKLDYFDDEINLYDVVDNDYINYCKVIFESDEKYEIIKSAYLNNEFDISKTTPYSYIEAASDDLKMFLVRK